MSAQRDRPIIAVTSGSLEYAEESAAGVERAGGEPWVVLPGHGLTPGAVLDRAAALVLIGGEDVHPSRYGEAPGPTEVLELNEQRDEMEIYDIDQDPGEQRDRSDLAQRIPQLRAALDDRSRDLATRANADRVVEPLDADTREGLRALGYAVE